MKLIKYSLIIIFLGFINSCKEDKLSQTQNIRDLFPEKEKITGKPISLTNEELLSTYPMILVDSFLVFRVNKNKYLIRIYNIKTKKYVKDAIKKGRGPNEFITGDINSEGIGKYFSFYTPVQRTLYRYHIDSLLMNDYYSPEKLKDFNSNKVTVYNAITIHDSLFLGSGKLKAYRYALMNENGIIQYEGKYPEDGNQATYQEKSAAYQSSLKLKPDNTQFVSYYAYAGMLEIYRVNKNQITPVKKLHFHYPKYRIIDGGAGRGIGAAFTRNNKNGFADVAVSDSLIFALYSGRSRENYKFAEAFLANDILIFNWQGEPVKHYYSSEDMRKMVVMKENNTMYLFALVVNPEPKIYKYQLNDLNY